MYNNISKLDQKYQNLKTRDVSGQGFQYLVCKAGRNIDDCLLTSVTLKRASFIIRDDTPGYKKLYYVFHNYADFIKAFPPGSNYKAEECILENMRQCPKYDVDDYRDDDHKNSIRQGIVNGIFICHNLMDVRIVECDSSGYDAKLGRYKRSCHFIVPDYVYTCSSDAAYVSKKIHGLIPEPDRDCFDYKVNKPRQNFRVPGATKNDRTKKVPEGFTAEELMITCGLGISSAQFDTRKVKELTVHKEIVEFAEEIEQLSFDENNVISLAGDHVRGHKFRSRVNNTLFFDRIKSDADPYCIICDKNHDSDNTVFLTINGAGIWLGCIKPDGEMRKHRQLIVANYEADIVMVDNIIEGSPRKYAEPKSLITADDEHIIAEAGLHLYGHTYLRRDKNYLIYETDAEDNYCPLCNQAHEGDYAKILITYIGAYYHCTHSPDQKVVISNNSVKEILYKGPPIYDHAAMFGGRTEIYDDPRMRPFTTARTLYVRAHMKMGKTNMAIEFMNDYKSIIVVSFRKSFTREKLAAFKDLGFVSYESIKGKINLAEHPRIIIQVESLHRLVDNSNPDLVMLDESESIFDEFKSTTMSEGRLCMILFEEILKSAKCCLSMDANMGPRTFEHIRRARGTDDELFIHNAHENGREDTIKITCKKAVLIQQIHSSISSGHKFAVATNSRSIAEEFHAIVIKHIPADQVLLITAKTHDIKKKEIFADVNTEWAKYRVVIYSPTCGAGISFTMPHFDMVFGYFTDNSCTVEACRQMLYRVRDVRLRQYNICIITSHNRNQKYTLEKIRRSTQESANISSVYSRALNYEPAKYRDDKRLPAKFTEDLLFDVVTYADYIVNLTRTDMLRLFINQCKETGAAIIESDAISSDETRAINDESKKIRQDIDAADSVSIAGALDITGDRFEYIKENSSNINESLQIRKFILRSAYNWSGPLDADFTLTYGNQKCKNIYRNLRAIMQTDSVDQSLMEIKLRNTSPDETINHNHTYTRHYVANELLQAVGFTSILDDRMISAAELELKCADKIVRDRIISINKYLPGPAFDNKKQIMPGRTWAIKYLLEFINGIFQKLYGFTIKSPGQSKELKNNYKICHQYLGKIFPTEKSENRPSVILGWNPNGKPIQDNYQ